MGRVISSFSGLSQWRLKRLCTSMLVTHRDELSLVLRLSKPLLCTFHWCGRNGYPKGDHLQFDIFFILGVYVYS